MPTGLCGRPATALGARCRICADRDLASDILQVCGMREVLVRAQLAACQLRLCLTEQDMQFRKGLLRQCGAGEYLSHNGDSFSGSRAPTIEAFRRPPSSSTAIEGPHGPVENREGKRCRTDIHPLEWQVSNPELGLSASSDGCNPLLTAHFAGAAKIKCLKKLTNR